MQQPPEPNEKGLAFYDAVRQNELAMLQLGDDVGEAIARQLVRAVRESTSIDRNLKESERAALRAKVRSLLNR